MMLLLRESSVADGNQLQATDQKSVNAATGKMFASDCSRFLKYWFAHFVFKNLNMID